MLNYTRALIFYLGYTISLIIYATGCVVFGWPLPLKSRYRVFLQWNRFAVWWLKISCGVSYRISGTEHIPSEPYVLLSNHQSQWETLFLTYYFLPICAILKKELLKLPFFGWGLMLLKPIAIDRSKRNAARDSLLTQGKQHLEDGFSILIFPEGTRVAPDVHKKFSTGGAELAIACGVKVLPVAHNAGRYWPARSMSKNPGCIEVVIGPAMDSTDRDPRELTAEIQQWVLRQQL